MDPVVDLSQLIAEYGQVYKKGGQGPKDLREKIFISADTDEVFNKILTTETRLENVNADIGSVLQSYQDTFTPKGDIDFEPNAIDLHAMKIDWKKNPTSIWNTWIGFLASEKLDRKDWPFIKYIVEKLILPKMQEEWELACVFHGVKAATVPGTASSAGASINGIKKILNMGIAAGKFAPLSLGAVPVDPVLFVEYVEEMYHLIPKEYLPFISQFNFSSTLETRFKVGMRTKYNVNYLQATDMARIIDTNIAVKGYRSHEGSNKIWATPKGNAILAVKHSANEGVFNISSEDRFVKLFTDFWKGIGFLRYQDIFTNDVELVS